MDYDPRNREKARRPRGRRYWCGKCDRNHVHSGERCGVCGHRNGKTREKASKSNLSKAYASKAKAAKEI